MLIPPRCRSLEFEKFMKIIKQALKLIMYFNRLETNESDSIEWNTKYVNRA